MYEFLTEEGLEVDRGVGCAGFRVDFAISDPDDDGRYIAGILTDGEMYSRSSVARDRDRLREEILRNLGWNIVHLWSSDWYRNPEETRRKLRGTIEEIITVERKARTPDDQDLIQEEAHEDEAREETMDMEAEGGVVQNDESDHEGSVSQDDPEAGAVRPSMDDGVTGYMEYTTDKLREPDDLYRSSTPAISSIVSEIVAMEAPVHVEEVIRRIRESCGLRRAGRRVRSIIGSAIEMAENNGNIKREGDFLFLRESTPITVRKRTGRIDINLISPAEIEEAVKMALKSPLTVDELTVRVARMFGFRNTSRKTSAGIRRVIDDMLARGDLVMEGDTVRKGG